MRVSRRAEKILRRMRQSAAGWKPRQLYILYRGYGFSIRNGAKHDVVVHPDHPELRTTIPRHRELAKIYIRQAIALIDKLLALTGEKEGE